MEVRKEGGKENGGTACSLSARGQQDKEIKEQCKRLKKLGVRDIRKSSPTTTITKEGF